MFRRLVCLLALAIPGTLLAEDVVAPPAEPIGAKVIFNGKDLTGWDGDPTLWSVKDGVIHGETTEANPAKGNTFLIWKDGMS